MTYEEIITDLYDFIGDYCEVLANGSRYKQDLVQECILVVLEMDRSDLLERHKMGYLKGYVVGIVYRSWRSSTSPFHLKIRDYGYRNMELENFSEFASRFVFAHENKESFTTYDKYKSVCKWLYENKPIEEFGLFVEYFKQGTIKGLHNEVNSSIHPMSYSTVGNMIRDIKKEILDAYNNNDISFN